MNYDEASDFDINEAVAIAYFSDVKEVQFSNSGYKHPAINVFDGNGVLVATIDYCNNPSDMWPIIVANRIAITPPRHEGFEDIWQADYSNDFSDEDYFYVNHTDKNPLRAAAIVFLKMMENENE